MSNISKKLIILNSTGKTVFTTSDLAILWNIENKKVLKIIIFRAVKNNYLVSVSRGVYALAGKEVDVFELAGKLKKFSYISFETVLSQAGVIFQWYNEIISASDRKSTIKNSYGEFEYRSLPSSIMLNNKGLINKGNYYIASAERAFCDKVYKDGMTYFDDIKVLDKEKLLDISKIYNKRLISDIKKICA